MVLNSTTATTPLIRSSFFDFNLKKRRARNSMLRALVARSVRARGHVRGACVRVCGGGACACARSCAWVSIELLRATSNARSVRECACVCMLVCTNAMELYVGGCMHARFATWRKRIRKYSLVSVRQTGLSHSNAERVSKIRRSGNDVLKLYVRQPLIAVKVRLCQNLGHHLLELRLR